MAAKGSLSKDIITKKILETFPGSFTIDKVIRVPMTEDGVPIQIKVQLTAAKDLLSPEGKEEVFVSEDYDFEAMNPPVAAPARVEPTQEEKDNVAAMLKALNL